MTYVNDFIKWCVPPVVSLPVEKTSPYLLVGNWILFAMFFSGCVLIIYTFSSSAFMAALGLAKAFIQNLVRSTGAEIAETAVFRFAVNSVVAVKAAMFRFAVNNVRSIFAYQGFWGLAIIYGLHIVPLAPIVMFDLCVAVANTQGYEVPFLLKNSMLCTFDVHPVDAAELSRCKPPLCESQERAYVLVRKPHPEPQQFVSQGVSKVATVCNLGYLICIMLVSIVVMHR